MAHETRMPNHLDLLNPLLQAIHDLGGSGTTQEINEKAVDLLDFPDEVLNVPHNAEKSSRTEVEYRLAWARNYLKHYGILENSARGVWAILPDKKHVTQVDPAEVGRAVREMLRQRPSPEPRPLPQDQQADEEAQELEEGWKEVLHGVLTEEISPEAFERLAKRILRESGFVQVEVTGQSGDGGIDGKGIVRVAGLLSFHVIFQCKRYQGAVSASQMRDFRGAMIGRADKGLFITTGTFTREAIREATRDGAPPIDLVDGEQLADKLKELGLGVRAELVEQVTVDPDWFRSM